MAYEIQADGVVKKDAPEVFLKSMRGPIWSRIISLLPFLRER